MPTFLPGAFVAFEQPPNSFPLFDQTPHEGPPIRWHFYGGRSHSSARPGDLRPGYSDHPRHQVRSRGRATTGASGVIGSPSKASPEKGRLVLDALVEIFDEPLKLLRSDDPSQGTLTEG